MPVAPTAEAKERLRQYTAHVASTTEDANLKKEQNEALATIRRYNERVKNPITAIRAKCVDCCGGSLKEVSECINNWCPLVPFRMGINPFNKKTIDRLAKEEADDET